MIQEFHELVNPLNIYALAVVLASCTAIMAGLCVKHLLWPDTETVSFSFRFVVVSSFFKLGYSTYESLSISGRIVPKYLNLDALVLLILFSFVMGATMYVIDLKRRVQRLRSANREANRILASAKAELEQTTHDYSSRK